MNEPKWYTGGETPSEPGQYVEISPNGVWNTAHHDSFGIDRLRDDWSYYGPIPDPPKRPPRIRRFTAEHEDWGTVSGVQIEGQDFSFAVTHRCFSGDAKRLDFGRMKNIRWWD